jgi:pimeloyl-ACP methyl ester carboxylesterase
LPPGLPDLPTAPRLPSWLTCGSDDQPLDARTHAMDTFGSLVAALEHPRASAQTFLASDFRYFSYDANSPTTYTPATTRQSLDDAAAALEREFAAWHQAEPRATFDLVGHSLGGVIAALWVAGYATADQLRYVHAVVTLDSPVAGYPQPLYGYIEPYLAPLFGAPAQALSANSATMARVANAPARWKVGPGHYLSAIYNIGNLRDLIVPAFVATMPGADGIIADLGLGPDDLNHGAVLSAPKALAAVAGVLGTTGGPQLAS